MDSCQTHFTPTQQRVRPRLQHYSFFRLPALLSAWFGRWRAPRPDLPAYSGDRQLAGRDRHPRRDQHDLFCLVARDPALLSFHALL